MHPAASEWINQHADGVTGRVLDVGGRDINGSPKGLFPDADEYLVMDLVEHPSVDIVGDILDFTVDDIGTFACIVYAEVAEHSPQWRDHIDRLWDLLEPSGILIITAANPKRTPHSAFDGGALRDDEFYENVEPDELRDLLYQLTDRSEVDVFGMDVRAVVVKDAETPKRKAPAKKKAPAKRKAAAKKAATSG